MTPADTLSCRRRIDPENTPNIALSLRFRPSILTDRATSGGGLPDGPRFSRVDLSERRLILLAIRPEPTIPLGLSRPRSQNAPNIAPRAPKMPRFQAGIRMLDSSRAQQYCVP
jgi:hypothetical protein